MHRDELVSRAVEARESAWAPYSSITVGAALLTRDGRVFTGSNVENASYGLTVCAERVAVFAAVVEGHRDWEALVVASADGLTPCGACRQVLAEFASELPVHLVDGHGHVTTTNLGELFPVPPQIPRPDR